MSDTANTVYQATVTALETLLPPRVVSRTLQEGLQALTKTPATLQYADVDKILKVHVYRQLQVVMPVTEAKTKLQHIMESLKKLDAKTESGVNSSAAGPATPSKPSQEAALGELRARLKPFNLYFEWPEVQKLRAQLQLLDAEYLAGRETGRLLEEARQNLVLVEEKLTDQLVYQAKALAELNTSFEVVKFLGGPKVRRLENLIGQVQTAQQGQSLAPAEVERAYKLTADLRKLMESNVALEAAPTPNEAGLPAAGGEADGPLSSGSARPDSARPGSARPGSDQAGTAQAVGSPDADVSARLLQLDLVDERRSLDKLASDYTDLLSYRPALAEDLTRYAAQLSAGAPPTTELGQLRRSFAAAAAAEREALSDELKEIREALSSWALAEAGASRFDTTELVQYLQVTLSVLDTSLPPLRDVQHLRSLYHLASSYGASPKTVESSGDAPPEDAPARSRAEESRLAAQLSDLHALEEQVSRYEGVTLPEFLDLKKRVRAARTLLEQDVALETLANLWALLTTVQTLLERRSTDFGGRLDAALETFEEVAKLNSEETFKVGALLQYLNGQRDAFEHVSAPVRDELAAALSETETLLSELQAQYGATRAVADQLVSSGALKGLFGFFDAPSAPPVQPAGPGRPERWVAEAFGDSGVQAVLLWDPQGRVLGARGLDSLGAGLERPDDLYPVLTKLNRNAGELGQELAVGKTRLALVELAHTALLSATLETGYRLALCVEPDRLDDTLLGFHAHLAELDALLVRP